MIPKKVYLVDDHPVVLHSYRVLIEIDPALVVCGEAGNAVQALKDIKRLEPNIVVIDISLGDNDGIELIRDVSSLSPPIPVLVASHHDKLHIIKPVFRAGAKGFFHKGDSKDNIRTAVLNVLAGKSYYSSSILPKVTDLLNNPSFGEFSARENEVLEKLGAGYKPQEIAEFNTVSVKTVETQIRSIMKKLNIDDRKELYKFACRQKKVE